MRSSGRVDQNSLALRGHIIKKKEKIRLRQVKIPRKLTATQHLEKTFKKDGNTVTVKYLEEELEEDVPERKERGNY